MDVTKEELEFAIQAVQQMERNPKIIHMSNNNETLMAVRHGLDNDCIKLLRTKELLFVENCMTPVELTTTYNRDIKRHDSEGTDGIGHF